MLKKPLLTVAIVAKWFECVIILIFKSTWCQSSEFEPTYTTGCHNDEGIFAKTHWDGEDQFLCGQKGG